MQQGREVGVRWVCRTRAGWQERVFGPSSIVDILPDHIPVQTIPLSSCMDRRSHYKENIIKPLSQNFFIHICKENFPVGYLTTPLGQQKYWGNWGTPITLTKQYFSFWRLALKNSILLLYALFYFQFIFYFNVFSLL